MTGLNLETFLQLLRVAPGAWASLGVALFILALMTWTRWGSRRALRKCLFLSIAAHIGLIFYGGSSPELQRYFRLGTRVAKPEPVIERIKVSAVDDPQRTQPDAAPGKAGSRAVSAWDRDSGGPLPLAEANRPLPRPDRPEPSAAPQPDPPRAGEASLPSGAAPEMATPAAPDAEPAGKLVDAASEPVKVLDPTSEVVAPGEAIIAPTSEALPTAEVAPPPAPTIASSDLRSRVRRGTQASPTAGPIVPSLSAIKPPTVPSLPPIAPPDRDLIATPVAATTPTPTSALDPGRPVALEPPTAAPTLDEPTPEPTPAPVAATPAVAAPSLLPGTDLRRSIRSGRPVSPPTTPTPVPTRTVEPGRLGSTVGALAQVTPSISSAVPALPRATGRRALAEVPSVYRSRLDPNRTALAQRAGASLASEQAVERALDWLARHQDSDGRWDGGTLKDKEGHVADTDDSFIVHCPPADICSGECYYGEADTALTGLSLLAYLGAGYTHLDGKYADTVARGVNFLRQSQKADGDLRGSSRAVGMYCHAIATLALCEAYALTGDPAIRPSVERGVAWLIRSRAVDGLAWRYAPGERTGDTSILGWAVMALKSAKTVGIAIPPPVQSGIATWLTNVSDGRSSGLAKYQPGEGVKPTMTAEAWACRQFLELGGPGPASDEAAASLLANPKDRGDYNIYYLYYGTLAMFQHGGTSWTTWNARVRDQVVGRQQTQGHKTGSWDPDDSPYGSLGGRIYSTALATLTLEVYYRFLRLYSPAEAAGPLAPRPTDADARRARFNPPRPPAAR